MTAACHARPSFYYHIDDNDVYDNDEKAPARRTEKKERKDVNINIILIIG